MEYRLATVLIKFRTKCRDMSCSSIGKIHIRFVLATTNSNFLRWSNSFRQAGPEKSSEETLPNSMCESKIYLDSILESKQVNCSCRSVPSPGQTPP